MHVHVQYMYYNLGIFSFLYVKNFVWKNFRTTPLHETFSRLNVIAWSFCLYIRKRKCLKCMHGDCCIRRYHVYQEIWQAAVGEELECDWEPENLRDRYAAVCCSNRS